MIDSLSSKLGSFLDFKSPRISFLPLNSNSLKSAKQHRQSFVVYLLRGKKLYSYLYSFDLSGSLKTPFILSKTIDIDIPLTVISDNRVDDEEELAEYFADISDYFEIGPTPSLLLLDPSFFYNLSVEGELSQDLNFFNYSPYVASETIYSTEKSSSNFTNVSFSSYSLLSAWGKCLTSLGSDCVYLGSYLYPLVDILLTQHESFGILDVNNSSTNLLLCSAGRIISKNFPFGINQYLNGQKFLEQDFVNRLSKSIVKTSSDNSFSTPQDIFVLSEQSLDLANSSFFNIESISYASTLVTSEGRIPSNRRGSSPLTKADSLSESLSAISLSSLSVIV